MNYDVLIVGAGPAGIFTALELIKHSDLKVAIVEKGPNLKYRICPARKSFTCLRCKLCAILSGWGGAGAFSDGKLTLSPNIGGWLSEFVSKDTLVKLIKYVDSIFLKFGAPRNLYGIDTGKIEDLSRRATLLGLRLVPMKLRHMGTEHAREVLQRMHDYLKDKIDIYLGVMVRDVVIKGGVATGVRTYEGKDLIAKNVVLAPGRAGASWLRDLMHKLGVRTWNNPVDIGVRIEFPAIAFEEFTSALYDVKLLYFSRNFDDKIRTFCVNPYGEVIPEFYEDVITVNGQTCTSKRTENTNMALLVSTKFTKPFNDPIGYGKYIARLANMLGGGVIVQRLGDLRRGRRSTPERIKRSLVMPSLKGATPGDLSFVLPHRILTNVLEMLEILDKLAPGVASDHTLVYGVEVKFYSVRVDVDSRLQVRNIKGLYAIGDGAGITRGLMQASISGVIVARNILRKMGYEDADFEQN